MADSTATTTVQQTAFSYNLWLAFIGSLHVTNAIDHMLKMNLWIYSVWSFCDSRNTTRLMCLPALIAIKLNVCTVSSEAELAHWRCHSTSQLFLQKIYQLCCLYCDCSGVFCLPFLYNVSNWPAAVRISFVFTIWCLERLDAFDIDSFAVVVVDRSSTSSAVARNGILLAPFIARLVSHVVLNGTGHHRRVE